MMHEVGEVDVVCPLCEQKNFIEVNGVKTYRWCDLEDGKDNEHTHFRLCPCCKGSGYVEVFVGEVDIGDIELDPPDHSWRD